MEHTHSQSFAISNSYCKSVLFNLNITLLQSSKGAINSIIRMCKFMFNPSAGNRNRINGLLTNQGTNGNCWRSAVRGTNARNLNFNSTAANTNNNNRANGSTVRCPKDDVCCFIVFHN